MFVYFAAVGWGSKKDLALPLMRDMGGDALFSYGYKKETEQCMQIYLASTSGERFDDKSVKCLLADCNLPHGLLSYAYKEQSKDWIDMAMQIHLADVSKDRGQYQALVDTNKTEHLVSEAYKDSHQFDIAWNQQGKKKLPRVLVDSGAFTAYTTGKVIHVKDYGKWALEFKSQWQYLMRSLDFFSLDVIGDEDASDKNLGFLESMGLKPLPIFTYKGDIKYLEKYIKNYDYLAFGGLVGKTTKEQTAWLDYCFKYVIAHYKKTGVMPKVHLLGVTKQPLLERYPCYSSDSSSWVSCLRFGGGNAIGKKRIPRYKESPEALAITIATLRAEIRKYKQMQEDVTKLWSKRGIAWDD